MFVAKDTAVLKAERSSTHLERAYALLAQSTIPVKQIAARLGFATPSSFTLAFRRATGTTPACYRRDHAVIG